MKEQLEKIILISIKCYFLATLFMIQSLQAQSFCEQIGIMKAGYEAEYSSYDAKGKLTGKQKIKVLEIRKENSATISKVRSVFFDKKDKETNTFEMEYRCEGDIFYVDLSNQLDPEMISSLGASLELEISGMPLAFPSSMRVGDKLPDANMQLEARSGSMRVLSMHIKNTNQTVSDKEIIKTAGREYDCFKITGDSEVKAVLKQTLKSASYFNPGAGVVKSENYDKNGKLKSYTLLTDIKN